MRVLKDDSFSSYSKVLSDNQINEIIKIVESKIDEAILNIEEAHFNINPKRIGYSKDNNIGCKYCKYKDICYVQEKDYIYLEEYKDLSFLGGEKNG